MIDQSHHWKEPLVRAANWMQRAKFDSADPDRTLVRLEREIFIGFYAIRKLLDTMKVTDKTRAMSFTLKYVPAIGKVDFLSWHHIEVNYDHDSVHSEERDFLFLCNLFIHSYVYTPFIDDDRIAGVYVASDRIRSKKLYIIDLTQIILAFRSVGRDNPRKVSILRDPDTGKFEATVE